MILFLVTLAYLAFWSPRWTTLIILTLLSIAAATGVLLWTSGLLNPGVDYRSPEAMAVYPQIARALALNTLLYVGLGIVIVFLGKRRREEDARQMELLAKLTKPPSES